MYKYLLILSMLPFWAAASDEPINCEQAYTTMDMNTCSAMELKAAQTEMSRYLEASLNQQADDPEVVESIKTAQKDWHNYYTSHCHSVYEKWREGTIRGVMFTSCKTELTKQRTHELWKNFLTFMDDSEPVLPEPEVNQ
ncbi:lysozyme inhibitor LprI family protein [Vibrio rumoiensis]|uniref:Lysozyme inhibitor LprI-like N-terminal domain-containing protein n=1 Tax=Vibrio rumoiensis 1S-45 TaxID=1188252 RepID=A0A1E5E467_9VIBR|nr:lysozyme inhibitor LprI family protein [Vibrio rumoiensis]OEF27470.1 hypothetical protein A1QC_15120 [Vibrio rumoiensis 1S-45]